MLKLPPANNFYYEGIIIFIENKSYTCICIYTYIYIHVHIFPDHINLKKSAQHTNSSITHFGAILLDFTVFTVLGGWLRKVFMRI